MKRTILAFIVIALLLATAGCAGSGGQTADRPESKPAPSGPVLDASGNLVLTSNDTGTHKGFFYSFWKDSGRSVSMTLGDAGHYSTNWKNCGNFVCGLGWMKGTTRSIVYAGSFDGGNNGYLALYGWTRTPLIEYYVVENHGDWTPPGSSPVGSFECDGGTYRLHRTERVNMPSIEGTSTFYQYWSVRTTKRSGGTITFPNHIKAWKDKGWNLGSRWDYQIMATEGYTSSGSSDVTVREAPAPAK
jgi:endo-1,4-beta-xylanase